MAFTAGGLFLPGRAFLLVIRRRPGIANHRTSAVKESSSGDFANLVRWLWVRPSPGRQDKF